MIEKVLSKLRVLGANILGYNNFAVIYQLNGRLWGNASNGRYYRLLYKFIRIYNS